MKKVVIAFWLGLMVASGGTALAAQAVGWFVESEGTASGSLGTLEALKVTDARAAGEGLLPGESLAVKVDIENGNRVALTLAAVEIGDLRSGDETCDASLADSRLRFDRSPDILVQPGENDAVVLGSVRLPKALANSCQGRDIDAEVAVRATYGVED